MSEKKKNLDIHDQLVDAGKRISDARFVLRETAPDWPDSKIAPARSSSFTKRHATVAWTIAALLLIGLGISWFVSDDSSVELAKTGDRESLNAVGVDSEDTAARLSNESADVAQWLANEFTKKHQIRVSTANFELPESGNNSLLSVGRLLNSLTSKQQISLGKFSTANTTLDEFTFPSVRFRLSLTSQQ